MKIEFVYIRFNGRVEPKILHEPLVTGEEKEKDHDRVIQRHEIPIAESRWDINTLMLKYPLVIKELSNVS